MFGRFQVDSDDSEEDKSVEEEESSSATEDEVMTKIRKEDSPTDSCSESDDDGTPEVNWPFKKKVYEILKTVNWAGQFAVGGELAGAPYTALEIKGFGKLKFPIYKEEAEKLTKVLEPSPFGRKSQTLLDSSVRNSWQLDPTSFQILNADWESYVRLTVLPLVINGLGITNVSVKASLYKFLLYEPGSFFKPHRDTEKEDHMFGTLVIQLPSEYEGGQLSINHDNKNKVFDFTSKVFSTFYAAFYADCQHEILPVTRGYRTCLVYNLISRRRKDESPRPIKRSMTETKLAQLLTNQWPADQKRLVYVFKHRYTEAGLSLQNLKLADRAIADLLLTLGRQSSLTANLAIFMKLETGNERCYGYWKHRADKHKLVENTDYSLRHFVSDEGEKLPIRDQVMSRDWKRCVIPGKIFDGVKPDGEEFENTGNEGADLQRWYNRAAVVLYQPTTDPKNKKFKKV